MEESGLQINFSDKKQTLLLTVVVQAFLCIPFSICAFFVASTANAGEYIFNLIYRLVFMFYPFISTLQASTLYLQH